MQMIGHDHELMQDVFLLLAIMSQHNYHQFGFFWIAEQRYSLPRHGCDEEGSIEGHSRIVGVLAKCVCDIGHNLSSGYSNSVLTESQLSFDRGEPERPWKSGSLEPRKRLGFLGFSPCDLRP